MCFALFFFFFDVFITRINGSTLKERCINGAFKYALLFEYLFVARILIAANVDVDTVDDDGRTTLSNAAYRGKLDFVKKLIAAKADVDKADSQGKTPLIHAASYIYPYPIDRDIIKFKTQVVKELIAAKADVNKTDFEGRTPLIHAARYGYLEATVELMNAGSDLLLITKNQFSEETVIDRISSFTPSKVCIYRLIENKYQGLNPVAKLELLKAFSFMSNNYNKFSQFYSKDEIEAVKASLQGIDYIDELTRLIRFEINTVEGCQKLDNQILLLKGILENLDKYSEVGIKLNKHKIQLFCLKARGAVNIKYADYAKTIKNSIKALMPKDNAEDSDTRAEANSSADKPVGLTDLPNEIFAKIFHEVLLENKAFKQNPMYGEVKLLCATSLLCNISMLHDHLKELGAEIASFE
ncbi:MAG: ankyrin [Rickettsiaceae bacterium]|jgi:hypothetical protein|nr:ankyrin [Rickettsiaceae bacterium]